MNSNTPSAALDGEQTRAWHAFIDAQASLLRRLEADLVAEAQLTLAEYDVLVQLNAAPDGRLRMTELSDRVRISRSGLTRLIDRLVDAGLVERQRCPSDRRGAFAALTDPGTQRIASARPIHHRGIREYFAAHLTAAQLAAIATALEPLGASMPKPDRDPVA
ncbi:MAG TPA: MarR family transcriptional regulator [Candidatus Limnocylindrales bacterium]|nr:MarR family transcriptional regulator [Candidatus Limnocylindrales bacterium]